MTQGSFKAYEVIARLSGRSWGPTTIAPRLCVTALPRSALLLIVEFFCPEKTASSKMNIQVPPTQYGHVPSSSEGYYSSHMDEHEAAGLYYPRNKQASHPHRISDEHVPMVHAHQGSIRSLEILDSNSTVFSRPLQETRRRNLSDRLGDWWWWELLGVSLSLSCTIAIIVTLSVMQNKSLSSWHSSISPNALISVCDVTITNRTWDRR